MQTALIVDDSKTARVSLGRLLQRQGYRVAAVESGEQALQYLQQQAAPTLVFMDHMMPGMDGFQAVKAIKANPSWAAIPIVMYTSQEGDIYFGQAKALGAVDILSKPASDEDLSSLLQRLQLSTADTAPGVEIEEPFVADNTRTDTLAVVDLSGEFAQLDTSPTPASTTAVPTAEPRGTLPMLLAGLLILLLLASWFWFNQQLERQAQAQLPLYSAIEWSLNQQGQYDFGEQPFAGERLQLLQQLLRRLDQAGFRGTVRMEGHVGEFCLIEAEMFDQSSTWLLPPADASLAQCAAIGYTPLQAMQLSSAQSPAFSAFLQSFTRSSPVRIDLVGMGAQQPAVDYPLALEGITAGDWNAAALANNRVRFELRPEPPKGIFW